MLYTNAFLSTMGPTAQPATNVYAPLEAHAELPPLRVTRATAAVESSSGPEISHLVDR